MTPPSRTGTAGAVLRGGSRSADSRQAVRELAEKIRQPDPALVLFYCSTSYDLSEVAAELSEQLETENVLGCTSAGEIGPDGYGSRSLAGLSLPAGDFRCEQVAIRDIDRGSPAEWEAIAAALRSRAEKNPDFTPEECFALLLVDGLSRREESLAHAAQAGLGNVPLVGGSAADDAEFRRTFVYSGGEFRSDTAVLCLVQCARPVHIFKTEHFVATDRRLIVTGADAPRRIVHELDGHPATSEYARIVGVPEESLGTAVFAAHPVVVRVGGTSYVRSIMHRNDDKSLTFACAIDEGIVLYVAEPGDLTADLEALFRRVRERVGEPEVVLGFDCVGRAVEIDQKGIRNRVGDILRANNVVGFSTYGEQYKAMHVNQTFTGVAIGARRTRP